MAGAILGSTEYRTDEVQELYGFRYALSASVVSLFPNFLHRTAAPGAGEVNGWVNSGLDILTVEVRFAASGEFVALASTGIIV